MIIADVFKLVNNIWPAGAIMLGLGAAFALVLLIASIKLKVVVDPKLDAIYNALPKIDCGTCGYAGCGQYAKAIFENPELIGKCSPGGAAASAKIAEILNLQISDSGPAKDLLYIAAHVKKIKLCMRNMMVQKAV